MRHVAITDSCDHMHAVGSTPVPRYLGLPKRIFDVFIALLILPVVAPVLLLLWVPTRLDGGPALIGEEHVGKDGRRFTCWRLRTITVDSKRVLAYLCTSDPKISKDWQVNREIAKDLRTTGFGRFLRKSGLDDLPLLLNVLRGDMSFVGPQPLTAGQEHLYLAAGGKAYFHLRPGVTGPWQIEGRGAANFVDRVRFDDAYYSKSSLGCDLRLIGESFGLVLKGSDN